MKWYGIEVSKFCGAFVGGGTPVVAPKFNILRNKVKKLFNVSYSVSELETFELNMNKANKAFNVSYIADDNVVFTVAFEKPANKFNVMQL